MPMLVDENARVEGERRGVLTHALAAPTGLFDASGHAMAPPATPGVYQYAPTASAVAPLC